MPRIIQDPGIEVCPDFTSPAFAPLRETIAAARQVSHEEVAQELSAAWDEDNRLRVITWQQQEAEDEQARQDTARLAQEAEDRERAQQELEAETERREAEKKKPKIHGFNSTKSVGNAIAPRPSPFALNKLETFDYIELWYFTQEGCADAFDNQRAVAEDAYGLTAVDDFMALKPVSSFKASRNVVKDKSLTWRQMTMAKNSILQHMTKANWPDDHINALANFFVSLDLHEQRLQPNGEEVLLLYQARVRREWHDALKRNDGFNIAIINETLMRHYTDEVWDRIRLDGMRKVRIPTSGYVRR
jgi:hypothetical protein